MRRRSTLRDSGFDPMAWRDFLQSTRAPEGPGKYGLHSYFHPYAFQTVDAIVLSGAANPDRPRQVALAETLMPEMLERELEFYQREWRDEEEPFWLAAIEGWPFEAPR